MNFLLQKMSPLDHAVVCGLLLTALGSMAWLATSPPGRRVKVSDGNHILFVAPLDQPRQFALEGPLGTTQVTIDSAGVRIIESPCALKVCEGMGPVHRSGDIIACLPNKVLIQIEGGKEESESYDLLSR